MVNFWSWLGGYLTICLRGPLLEALLNKMAASHFRLWQIERLTADVIIARVPLLHFRKIRPLLWGTNVKLAIFDRHGLPFLIQKFKFRSGLLLGLILCLVTTVYLANFVWFIEIQGGEAVPRRDLQEVIEGAGLAIGASKKAFAPKEVEKALLTRFESLVWAQVSLKGVRAHIDLAERAGPEPHCLGQGHLYASETGLVTEVLVLRGTPVVQAGDTVQRGDLLISGMYYDPQGRKQLGRADGIVKARVWYQSFGEASFSRWEGRKTGVRHRQYLLRLGSFVLPLGRGYSPTTHHKKEREWGLSLGKAMLPLAWSKVEYHELNYELVSVSADEARQGALALAWERLESLGFEQGQIRAQRWEEDQLADQEGLRITLFVEVEENIGEFIPDPQT